MIKLNIKRPFLFIAFLICLLAVLLNILTTKTIILILPIIFLMLLLFIKQKRVIILAIIFMLLFLYSFLNTANKIEYTEKFCFSKYDLKLLAVEEPTNHGDFRTVKVKSAQNGKFPEGLNFTLYYNDSLPINAGDIFSAKVAVKPVDNNEYKLYNYSNGVFFKLNLRKYNENLGYNRFYRGISKLKSSLETKIFLNLSSNSAATMCGITYGDDSFLSDEFSLSVRKSGVSHIMVVSGLHLAIIMTAILKLFDKIIFNRYLKALLSFVTIFFLCGICGFTVSIIRASIMYLLGIFAPLVLRESDSANNLGVAVVLISFLTPYSVFNVSFLLSVLATYGVIELSPFYYELLSRRINKYNFWLKGIVSMLSVTICAYILTLPVLIYYFGEISLISPITNLAISYPVTITLTLNFVALIISYIPIIGIISVPIFKIVDILSGYINSVISLLGSYGYSAITVSKICLVPAILLILVMIFFMYFKKNKKIKEDKNVGHKRRNA